MIEPLHTPAETAKILGISVKTLRKHVRDGKIRSVKVGTGKVKPRRMFTDKNIATFVQAQKVREVPPCPSIVTNAPLSTSMISKSNVIGFTELLKQKASAKLSKSSGT